MSTTNLKPGKTIQEILSLLGEPYIIRKIDKENVIYRSLGHYELEVSGLDNNRKSIDAVIFVWAVTGGRRRAETIEGISSTQTLIQALDNTTRKYLHSPALS